MIQSIPDLDEIRMLQLKLKTEAKPVITMINEVREDFYSVAFRGITEEELEIQARILRQMFDNTKIAMEEGINNGTDR